MKNKKLKIIMLLIIINFTIGVLKTSYANTIEGNTSLENNNGILIGGENEEQDSPSIIEDNKEIKEEPEVTHYVVEGNVNNNKKGIDFYKDINISLVGNNLTDKNFLTKEGLHWSNKTYVELIKGEEIGILNDEKIFGKQNTPTVPIKAFRNNVGDSGRINYVGKTKSNEDLDLIWTITSSDRKQWEENSGYNNNNRIKGLGFSGEQFIQGAAGNSIVVLYNNASNLGIHYKIVKHGTMEEMKVVLSFISTDIDAAQGVETNLANITEIVPKESNLVKKDNVIYDNTPRSSRIKWDI